MLPQFLLNRIDPLHSFNYCFKKMQTARAAGWGGVARHYWRKMYFRHGCQISPYANLSIDLNFPHPIGIVIGDGVEIRGGCTIYQNVTIGKRSKEDVAYPVLEEGCTVYAGAIIAGDICLKKGSVIGAGAVVTKSNKLENDVLVGIPAVSVKSRKSNSYVSLNA